MWPTEVAPGRGILLCNCIGDEPLYVTNSRHSEILGRREGYGGKGLKQVYVLEKGGFLVAR